MRICDNYIRKIAVFEALVNVLSPYQLWGQKMEISALERKFAMEKMELKIRNMGLDSISEKSQQYLAKIDFDSKKWKKTQRRVTKFKTEEDCVKEIARLINEILTATLKHKKEIHEEVDHPGLSEISEVFDMRLWDFGIEGKIKTEEKN